MRLVAAVSLSPASPSHRRRALLAPSGRFSLLKMASSEKLDLLLPEVAGCDALLARMQHWLMARTEPQRRRLAVHLKKNWLRLVVSLAVLVVQFLWIASGQYLGLEPSAAMLPAPVPPSIVSPSLSMPAVSCHSNVANTPPQPPTPPLLPASPPPPPSNMHLISHHNHSKHSILLDSVIIQINQTTGLEATLNACATHPSIMPSNAPLSSPPSSPPPPPQPSPSSPQSILWKILFALKLALMLAFFEALRLLDTLVASFRPDADEDEKAKTEGKSPVDLGYIERNRGYK